MARSPKPYRRFRARGRGPEGADGLQSIREMAAKEAGQAGGPADPPRSAPERPGRAEPAPPPPRRPERPSHDAGGGRPPGGRDRGGRRRFWSFRNLGPAGWIGRIALILLVGMLLWSGLGYLSLRGAVGDANAGIAPAAERALDASPGGMLGNSTNTLILGVDKRRGETRGRADTILLMRTDPDAGRLRYLSIPRDFRVDIPNHGPAKINAAFAVGGQAGMIRAVRRLTGVPVHHLVVVRFDGLSRMVDALGGVTVTNPTAIDCYYEAGRTVQFPQGRVELDGERALEFARVRRCDDDFRRAMRQQLVVSAMRDKVLEPSSLWRAPWRGAAVVRTIQTDIGTTEMVKMAWLQARLTQDPADRIILSGEPMTIDGQSYVVGTDPDRNEREIAQFMGVD